MADLNKTFVMSSCERVENKEYTKIYDSTENVTIVRLQGITPNKPVNLQFVSTFFGDIVVVNLLELPVIKFFNTEKEIIVWYYPPTETGRTNRNRDLNTLRYKYCDTVR